MLHLWCQGAALLLALLFESLYSGFSVGRRTLFLHSKLLIRFAALRSVSLRLQSLNQKTLTEYHWFITESLHGSVFWFFLFDFLLTWIVPCRTNGILDGSFFWLFLGRTRGILDGFVYWFCLRIKWFVWFGRLVFNLIYANVFFEH